MSERLAEDDTHGIDDVIVPPGTVRRVRPAGAGTGYVAVADPAATVVTAPPRGHPWTPTPWAGAPEVGGRWPGHPEPGHPSHRGPGDAGLGVAPEPPSHGTRDAAPLGPDRTPARPPAVLPVVASPSAGLPVLAPQSLPAPRRGLAALWDLVFARRRCGRHRPDTVTDTGWSMFAPGRRRPRRWGGR